VGEHYHCRVLIDRLRQLFRAVDQAQAVTLLQHVGQAFGDVQVRGEVTAFGDNHPSGWRPGGLHTQRGTEHLEQVDRRRVGHHHFTVTGADQPGQAISQALGKLTPTGSVPATDQAIAPLLGDHLLSTRQCRDRARAQRIAIEINHTVG
jgi:hypothetical protein